MRAAAAARRLAPLAAVALVLWLAARVDWLTTFAALRVASPGLLALAVAAELVSVAAKALRWWLFLRPLGARGPGLAIRATFAGAGVNNLVVANGGEAARVVLVARALGAPSARVLATIALDRAWEAVGYGVLLVVAAAAVPLPAAAAQFRPLALGCAAVVGAALAALVWWPRARGESRRDPAAHDGGGAASGGKSALARLTAHPRRFIHALGQLSTPRRSAAALALTMVVWLTQLATYAFAAAAARSPLSFAGNLATLLTVNLAFAVRVTPGGVGVFQALYALAARSFGVGGPAAVAAAILIQAVQILPITAIGALSALPELRRRGAGAAQ